MIAMVMVTTLSPQPARPVQGQAPSTATQTHGARAPSGPERLTRALREIGDHRQRRFLAPAPTLRGVVHALLVPVIATAGGEVASTPVELRAGPDALRPDPDLPRRARAELRGFLPGPGQVMYPVRMEIELRGRASRLFVSESESGLVPHPLLAVCLQVDRIDLAHGDKSVDEGGVPPAAQPILRSGVPGELLTNPIHSDQFSSLDEIIEQLETRPTGLGASGRLYVAGHAAAIRRAMEQENEGRTLRRSRAVARLVRDGALREGELLELHVYVRAE